MSFVTDKKWQKLAASDDVEGVRSVLASIDPEDGHDDLGLALRFAVGGGHVETVDAIFSAWKAGLPDNDCREKDFLQTLTAGAAERGHLMVLRYLVEQQGADVRGEMGADAVSLAVKNHRQDVVAYLKSMGASWATPALIGACCTGDLEQVNEALDAGADVETGARRLMDCLSRTPLMIAARAGHVDIVKRLIEAGARVDHRVVDHGVEGFTAIVNAAVYGKSVELIDVLVAAGANPNRAVSGTTVLMYAAEKGSVSVVKRLVELGADVHARDPHRWMSVMDYAQAGKDKDVIAYVAGFGVPAEREPGRSFARALVKAFGGKVHEHAHGFMVDSRISGAKSQFLIDQNGCQVTAFGLLFMDKALRKAKVDELVISRCEPKSNDEDVTFQPVPEAGRALGLGVYRWREEGSVPESFITAFCERRRDLLGKLALTGTDHLMYGGQAVRFAWTGMDMAALRPRLSALEALLAATVMPPQPLRRLFDQRWVVQVRPRRKGADSASRHRFGGKLSVPAACPSCGDATHAILRLDLKDPALPPTDLPVDTLPICWCLNCLEWGPTFFRMDGDTLTPLAGGAEIPAAGSATGREADLEECAVVLKPLLPGKRAKGGKVGGAPAWIQPDETPTCPTCARAMAFAAQLESDARISYGDAGRLYAFVCPECRVVATLIQSH